MITFKINGKSKEIPTSWEEVTYKQYLQLLKPTTSMLSCISVFTDIPEDILKKAELWNLESVLIALSFLNTPPNVQGVHTKMVGPYKMPVNVTLESLGQFEDLRELLKKIPPTNSLEDNTKLSDLYLEACAIYVQKIIDGTYDTERIPEVKEILKDYSCMEVLQSGAFFLYRPITISANTTTRYQSITQHLKKMLPDLPNFHRYLDSLLPSSKQARK